MNPTAPAPCDPENAGECGNCEKRRVWVLHHVRLRGIHRLLCTSCVLRLHPSSFCPFCFDFYNASPPHPSRRLSCSKCSSFTHTHCVASPSSPFLCPPCRDPLFSFFDVDARNGGPRSIDKKLADALLCAAKIASASMEKAVKVARSEMDRKVKEAALARKRAREALEHVVLLAGKEKIRVPQSKDGCTEVLDVKRGGATLPAMIEKKENGTAKATDDPGGVENDGEKGLEKNVVAPVKQEDGGSGSNK